MTETQQEQDEADCTVAICGACKRVQLIIVTSHINHGAGLELGELARDGADIKHMSAREARQLPFGCECGL